MVWLGPKPDLSRRTKTFDGYARQFSCRQSLSHIRRAGHAQRCQLRLCICGRRPHGHAGAFDGDRRQPKPRLWRDEPALDGDLWRFREWGDDGRSQRHAQPEHDGGFQQHCGA